MGACATHRTTRRRATRLTTPRRRTACSPPHRPRRRPPPGPTRSPAPYRRRLPPPATSAARPGSQRSSAAAAQATPISPNPKQNDNVKAHQRNPPLQIHPLPLVAAHKVQYHAQVEPAQRHLAHLLAVKRAQLRALVERCLSARHPARVLLCRVLLRRVLRVLRVALHHWRAGRARRLEGARPRCGRLRCRGREVLRWRGWQAQWDRRPRVVRVEVQ
jgi:hypothetical protein